jgi:hypothetical protein
MLSVLSASRRPRLASAPANQQPATATEPSHQRRRSLLAEAALLAIVPAEERRLHEQAAKATAHRERLEHDLHAARTQEMRLFGQASSMTYAREYRAAGLIAEASALADPRIDDALRGIAKVEEVVRSAYQRIGLDRCRDLLARLVDVRARVVDLKTADYGVDADARLALLRAEVQRVADAANTFNLPAA